jgi:hypothetical protein
MHISQLDKLCGEFFADCMEILMAKGRDYAPNDKAFESMEWAAQELRISVEQVLGVHMIKQWSAICTFLKEDRLETEPIEQRLKDMANYCALLYVWLEEKEVKQARKDMDKMDRSV